MMNKLNSLMIIILCTYFILLVGCTNEHKDNIFIIDVVNDETNIKTELTTWNQEYFENKEVPAEKELTFYGNVYKGVYSKSIIKKWESYTTNMYYDGNGVKLGVKDNTDQLVLLNLMNSNFFETEPFKKDVENSEEYALVLAKEIAESYINIEEYELLIDEPETREKIKDEEKYYITYYTFTFAKKINNIYTSDFLSVKITSKGNLASLYVGDIGVFNEIGKKDFSIAEINKMNESKILNVYKSKSYDVIDQNIDYQRLVVTPEGCMAMYTATDVLVKANKEDNIIETGICLLSYIK
ncbi:MAG: hypothetical protein ACOX40_00770 [Bacilli bacterium]